MKAFQVKLITDFAIVNMEEYAAIERQVYGEQSEQRSFDTASSMSRARARLIHSSDQFLAGIANWAMLMTMYVWEDISHISPVLSLVTLARWLHRSQNRIQRQEK